MKMSGLLFLFFYIYFFLNFWQWHVLIFVIGIKGRLFFNSYIDNLGLPEMPTVVIFYFSPNLRYLHIFCLISLIEIPWIIVDRLLKIISLNYKASYSSNRICN